jgi:hypothetical protein
MSGQRTQRLAMLTTSDNPHDPFDAFEDWFAYDTRAGHHTTSFLARIVIATDELSEASHHEAIEAAIDEIVDENVNGLYVKVTREVESKF